MKDVVIIGGGPGGVTAALLFSKMGKSTSIITERWTLLFSSGTFDLFIPPDENPSTPEDALCSLFRNHPEHILARITRRNKEIVWEGLETLSSIYPFFTISKENEKFHNYISDMGNTKKSWGALKWIAHKEYFEGRGKNSLVLPSDFLGRKGKSLLEIIRAWTGLEFNLIEIKNKNPELKTSIISAIMERDENFLLPPIFCGDYGRLRSAKELLPTFESLNGLWLNEVVFESLIKNDVDVIEERVVHLEIRNRRALKAITDKGKEVEGDFFIISTGKFLGSGCPGRFLKTKEVKEYSALLTSPNPTHSQGLFSIGLKVDEKMRVYEEYGRGIENIFACGMVISNVDPFSWSMGFGFSALTAYILSKSIDA